MGHWLMREGVELWCRCEWARGRPFRTAGEYERREEADEFVDVETADELEVTEFDL